MIIIVILLLIIAYVMFSIAKMEYDYKHWLEDDSENGENDGEDTLNR